MTRTLPVTRSALRPFGTVVRANEPDTDLRSVPLAALDRLALAAKVVVLRGFRLLDPADLVDYCQDWGEILTWDFGAVLDLVIHEEPRNYLFGRGDVPFHWDGAFAGRTPRFFLFQCVRAPAAGSGGETVFTDTTEVVRRAGEELRRRWAAVEITYRTDKVEHYGGQTTAPLLSTHPATGAPVLRYAEPLDPLRYRNPLFLTMSGVAAEDAEPLMADLSARLRHPEVCYQHQWCDGDIVVVDNNALLHGRNAFLGDSSRHLQRIQVL